MNPTSPDGLNLKPSPALPARISRRAMIAVAGLAVLFIFILIYGAEKRRRENIQAEVERQAARTVEPASADEVLRGATTARPVPVPAPEPGLTLPAAVPPEQIMQIPQYIPPQMPTMPEKREPTAAELAAERMRLAMLSPMRMKSEDGTKQQTPVMPTAAAPAVEPSHGVRDPELPTDEYTLANFAARKEAWLAAARGRAAGNYLQHTRAPQVGICEIKAGWEIPAVLEQEINSDLPGDIKALVNQNVYDTATGRYLLIPQGSRLVGRYNSEVAYGQEAAQVVWDRIIFPDGSSVNLAGMIGLDSQGKAGFRHKVDRHYKRTFGMAFLTSAFVAAYELTQRRSYGAGGYYTPGAGDRAAGAFGGEMSNTAATVTRRNMLVQPTIKIPAGYKFTVRVQRDMLFAEPYAPHVQEPELDRPPVLKTSR
jgi:type IV secretion system protein VirB10